MGWKELKSRFPNASSVAKTITSAAQDLRRAASAMPSDIWHSCRLPFIGLLLRSPCKGKTGDVRFGDVEVLWDPTEKIDPFNPPEDAILGTLRFEAWKAVSPSTSSCLQVVEAVCVRLLRQRLDDMKVAMKTAISAGAARQDLIEAADELVIEFVMDA